MFSFLRCSNYRSYIYVFLAMVMPALASEERVIPSIDDISPAYLSTTLLLNPCVDVTALGFEESEDITRQVVEARSVYPAGTCDNKVLVEKLFKVRFLQRAMITLVSEPWQLDIELGKQDELIAACKDLVCLENILDEVILKLAPLYLNPPAWGKAKPLCGVSVEYVADKEMAAVVQNLVSSLSGDNSCGGHGATADEFNPIYDKSGRKVLHNDVNFDVCKSANTTGHLFIAECQMAGNQVNSQTWIYLLQKASKPKLLFNADDGPFYTLATTSHGMPDLLTNARYNMGEHLITFYRFNGEQYEEIFSYMNEAITGYNSKTDLSIAR